MLAGPVAVAVDSADSAALLVAQVLVDLVVPAPLSQEAELPALAQPPVLAHLVVEAAVPRDLLSRLNRQSFSAAMARSTT
jgi:hypothetical protein